MQLRRISHATGVVFGIACILGATSCDSPLEPGAGGVDRVVVTPSSASLQAGETATLTALVLDASGNAMRDRKVVWSTQNSEIATVSQSGVVTGVAAGSVQIAASSGGKSANSTITVTPRPVSLVRVTPGTATVSVGSSLTLQAEAVDASGAPVLGRPVTWTSSDETIAVVGATGNVAGIAPGSVTITATIDGRSGTATIGVVPVLVGSIEITPDTVSLRIAQSVRLTAQAFDSDGNPLSNRTFTWISGAPSVATVNQQGDVTGVGSGTASVFAATEGVSAFATVSVSNIPVASVQVNPSTVTLQQGASVNLSAVVRDSAGNVLTNRIVTWSSSNDAIAVVSSSGRLTAVAVGNANVRATSEGVTGQATVTVSNIPVATVTVTPANPAIGVGQTLGMTATMRDANNNILSGRSVTWSTSNASVAIVNAQGLVSAIAPGSVIITAASEGKTGNTGVTVFNVPPVSLTVSASSNSLYQGETKSLRATIRDAFGAPVRGRNVNWQSRSGAVVSVSPVPGTPDSATFTGVGVGSTYIVAEDVQTGLKDSTQVTVSPVPVASVQVTPPSATLQLPDSVTLAATPLDSAGGTLTRTITWVSLDPSIATVSSSGVVNTLKSGTVTIEARANGAGAGGVDVVGTASITDTAVVHTIQVSAARSFIVPNDTMHLAVTLRDTLGNVLSGKPFTLVSSDNTIATAATGSPPFITGGASQGPATVTVSSEGKNGTLVVNGIAAIDAIVIACTSNCASASDDSVAVGATQQYTITVTGGTTALSGRTLTMTNSTPSAATAAAATLVTNSSGQITVDVAGVAAGSTTITFSSAAREGTNGSIKSASITIVVP